MGIISPEQYQAEIKNTSDSSLSSLQNPSSGFKFPLGSIVITPTASERISPAELHASLSKHGSGDWGDLSKKDWKENDLALANGFRLVSSYATQHGERFLIVTEADRSATTILLPSDH